ncbi:MAG TPA: hypothetical protein VGO18_23440 [Steroidobacteraceae bacterium]|nr:hypothetical protein [Steroidobacteraceae bacterium]
MRRLARQFAKYTIVCRWPRRRLADEPGVGLFTVAAFEKGYRHVSEEAIAALKATLEEAGLEFISENGGGAGIRFRERKDGTRGGH